MNSVTEVRPIERAQLASRALAWLRDQVGDSAGAVQTDTNLIEKAVIDSVGFIELVEFIERQTGLKIDLSRVEASRLSSIDGLCAHLSELGETPRRAGPALSAADSYSDTAEQYQEEEQHSCWGTASDDIVERLAARGRSGTIVDVGCGTGRALVRMAAAGIDAEFIGVEPARNMRERALSATRSHDNIRILDGRFERLPLESDSVDYLYSLYAFHWTSDVNASVRELARVLAPSGEMDLFFTGRETGREFTRVTTPIFRRYMGLDHLLDSAAVRVHMGKADAMQAFQPAFPSRQVEVEESYRTFHRSLDSHWSWWIARTAPHFVHLATDKREDCEKEIRRAIDALGGEAGIPYTVHTLHVSVRN